jgi:hypothetical protein
MAKRFIRESALHERLAIMGYRSVTDFFKAFPGCWIFDLNDKQFQSSLMPILLEIAHAVEAQANGCLREFAVDRLIRGLRFNLPKGRIHVEGKPLTMATISAIADVKVLLDGLGAATEKERVTTSWQELLKLAPPLGWRPKVVDDPLVDQAFERGWPVADKDSELRNVE